MGAYILRGSMAEKKSAPKKKPSAQKRDEQSERRRQRNRSFRASVVTAIRSFETALTQDKGSPAAKEKLDALYSLVDKGVKKGVFKPNKAARTKSRLSARLS